MNIFIGAILIIGLSLSTVLHSKEIDHRDLNLESFLKLASADDIDDESLSRERVEMFYQKNSEEIWNIRNEGEFWKAFTPLLISYNDKDFIRIILADRGQAIYKVGLMFGWTPMVGAPLKSKLPYVLRLTYFSDGVTGLKSFYKELEEEIESKISIELETRNRQHPLAKYDVLTGFVCSLPKVGGRTEKLVLATITMEYFEKLFENFLENANPESNNALITGLRDGLFNYYFYREGIDNPPSRKNTDFWPNKEECFDVRSYFAELADKEDEMSVEEGKFVERFRKMQERLGR